VAKEVHTMACIVARVADVATARDLAEHDVY
jgi:hypothetical protein